LPQDTITLLVDLIRQRRRLPSERQANFLRKRVGPRRAAL
jgi:hypothetical protein